MRRFSAASPKPATMDFAVWNFVPAATTPPPCAKRWPVSRRRPERANCRTKSSRWNKQNATEVTLRRPELLLLGALDLPDANALAASAQQRGRHLLQAHHGAHLLRERQGR